MADSAEAKCEPGKQQSRNETYVEEQSCPRKIRLSDLSGELQEDAPKRRPKKSLERRLRL
jgi:hypothetical protein